MRKLVALGAALAVMGALAFAIFTSGEAISFSEPNTDSRIGNNVPPDQSQPQDFAGAGSQFYYFGPNFMCQIFSNSKVECFGSDADGVVSNAPTQTGFTNVDGGETYACAFHQSTRFNYCWGSITLRPTTAQPTATSEPTSTPEPTATATALPPGVTPPAATATSVPTATATPEPDPCNVPLPSNAALPVTVSGQWTDACIYSVDLNDVGLSTAPDGDRYYRYINFVPTTATVPWSATVTSSEDTVMLLFIWNPQTERYDFVQLNDDIESGNTNSRITWTPIAGRTYLVDVTTYDLETTGSFSLTIDASSGSQGSSAEQSVDPANNRVSTPLERSP